MELVPLLLVCWLEDLLLYQPFRGQMIANCGVGPPPIVKKKFNSEALANAFRFCMLQSTQEKAKALGEEMRKENGIRTGVQVCAFC